MIRCLRVVRGYGSKLSSSALTALLRRIVALTLGLAVLTSAHAAEKPEVLASIKPVQLILAAIAGDELKVDLLLDPGFSPHSYHLKPSDVAKITETDLLVWIGPEMETFLSQVILSAKPSRTLTLLKQPKLTTRLSGAAQPRHGHDHHERGGVDAHIWLSPELAILVAESAAETFASMMPARRDLFQKHLEDFKKKVELADREIRNRLAPVKMQGFVVTHDGFSYWVDHYGLNQVAALAISPDRQPGARHIAQLRQDLENSRARCILIEPQIQPSYLDTLTEGLAIRQQVVDPLAGDIEPGPDAYPKFMRAMGASFAKCLQ